MNNPQTPLAFAGQIGPRETPIPVNQLLAAIQGLIRMRPSMNGAAQTGMGNSGMGGDVTNAGDGAQGVP